jgi:tryptophan 2,3-dioxygenase
VSDVTVRRIIGHLPGTGGTSRIGYLRNLLGRSFSSELHTVRSGLAVLP